MISGPVPLDERFVVNDRQVADYTFIKTLGKGTFGKVKLAEHMVTKQKVCLYSSKLTMMYTSAYIGRNQSD